MGDLNQYHIAELDEALGKLGTPIKAILVKVQGHPDMVRRVRIRGGLYLTVRCWGETVEEHEHYAIEALATSDELASSVMFELSGISFDNLFAQLTRVVDRLDVVEKTVGVFASLRVES